MCREKPREAGVTVAEASVMESGGGLAGRGGQQDRTIENLVPFREPRIDSCSRSVSRSDLPFGKSRVTLPWNRWEERQHGREEAREEGALQETTRGCEGRWSRQGDGLAPALMLRVLAPLEASHRQSALTSPVPGLYPAPLCDVGPARVTSTLQMRKLEVGRPGSHSQ